MRTMVQGEKTHWLAGSYSFCLPGLGQLYGRRFARAIFFFFLFLGMQALSKAHFWVPLFCLLAAVDAFKFSRQISTTPMRNYLYASVAVIAFCLWFLGFAPQVIPMAYGNDLALSCPNILAKSAVDRSLENYEKIKYRRFLGAGIIHWMGMPFLTGMALSNAAAAVYTTPFLIIGGSMAAVELVPVIKFWISRNKTLREYHRNHRAYVSILKADLRDVIEQTPSRVSLLAEAEPASSQTKAEEVIRLPENTHLNQDLWQIVSLYRDYVLKANSDAGQITSRRMVGALATQIYAKHHLDRESLLKQVNQLAPEVDFHDFLSPQ